MAPLVRKSTDKVPVQGRMLWSDIWGIPIAGRHRMTTEWTIDTELGEVLQENEEQLSRQIADHIEAKIRNGPRPALRDAHPKAHGCVRAEFQVDKDLPPDLAQGVFVPGTCYKAWIRFSNGNEDITRPDAKGDARGMAIKLLACQATRS